MADKTISALTSATTPLAGTEVLPIVQSSTTKKVTVANLTAQRTISFGAAAVDAYIDFKASGVVKGNIYADATTLYINTQGTNTNLNANGGNAIVGNGNVVIGTAGKGVDFSANTHATGMTSELLKWYEEGTANTLSGSLTTNFSFSSNQIRYTRIGDTVHVWFDYQWTSSNAGAGDTALDTLPFTASGDGVVTFTTMNGNIAADQVYGIVLNGTKTFKIYGRNNGTATLYGPAPRTIWDAGGVNVNKLIGYAVYKAA